MDGFDPAILQYSLMAATLVKIIVDVANIATPDETPRWVSPLTALGLGPLMVAALMLAGGTSISPQTIAQAIIAGVLSAGTASVASSLQARTKPSSHATDGLAADNNDAEFEPLSDDEIERIAARLRPPVQGAAPRVTVTGPGTLAAGTPNWLPPVQGGSSRLTQPPHYTPPEPPPHG